MPPANNAQIKLKIIDIAQNPNEVELNKNINRNPITIPHVIQMAICKSVLKFNTTVVTIVVSKKSKKIIFLSE